MAAQQDNNSSPDSSSTAADTAGQIDLNPAIAIERIDSWLDGLVRLLPNIVVAIIVFIVFWMLAKLVKRVIKRTTESRGRTNLGEVLGGFFKAAILVFGGLIAATIVVPTLNPGDLVAGLGVSSVAIGFAFKDILQNWLAGLLILLRQPFEVGDQIEVNGFEGTVDHIETRATIMKTYDGQKVVIPNSDIYTNAVTVKTGFDFRRSQYDIGIGYGDDVEEAQKIILDVLKDVKDVETDPAPQALPWDLAASWVTIRARWWTNSHKADVVGVRADVIMKMKRALDKAGIDMPYETQVHLFHDQTEDRDGQPGEQREGWPAPADREVKPRYKAIEESTGKKSSTRRKKPAKTGS
ncbi:MAG: mechanosensitive ion channel family protein [Acidimicrobiales bacterium]|nr:mechanosensitive ion channel family protein [Hyphomonadaceae bacterium]RZV41563.1 MAG: mechanosensitive ion channel family protein [Acidimicrobiales bacterium]